MLRKLQNVALLFIVMISLTAAVPPFRTTESQNSNEISNQANKMSIQQVLAMTPKQYEAMTGKTMNFKEKIAFSMMKKELKKAEVNKNNVIDIDAVMAETTSDFSWGGFFAGFLLGLIGVGLVYIFSNDSSVRRSSWKGLGVWLILVLIAAVL
jgi:hypothetical protein